MLGSAYNELDPNQKLTLEGAIEKSLILLLQYWKSDIQFKYKSESDLLQQIIYVNT